MTYQKGTIARCNVCQQPFALERDRNGAELIDTTARLHDFETCPHCDRFDLHYIAKRDVVPVNAQKVESQHAAV